MPTETETFLDETYTGDFDTPVESIPHVELEHMEVIERAFEHSPYDETRQAQVIEPEKIMLEEKRGGSAESWAREAAGEKKYFFDGTEAVNKETGGTLREEMAKGVESGTYNTEELQRYDEMMKQWQESGSSTYFLPDRIERTEDMEIRHVWYYVRHENGDVNWEAWKIETPVGKEEPDALREIEPVEIPTILHYELETFSSEPAFRSGAVMEVDAREAAAEAQTETGEQKVEQTSIESRTVFEETTPAVSDSSQEEPPAGTVDESWLSSFLAHDTIQDTEGPVPVALAETPTHKEATREFQAAISNDEKSDTPAQELFVLRTQTEQSTADAVENVTPSKEENKETGLRDVREPLQNRTVTVPETADDKKNGMETAHTPHKADITEPPQEVRAFIEKPIVVGSEEYREEAGAAEMKAGLSDQVLEMIAAPAVREPVIASTQNELSYRRDEKTEQSPTTHENNVVHIEDYGERGRFVNPETSRQEKERDDSRVDMLAYALGVHPPNARTTQTSQETRADTRAGIRATRPHEPVAPTKRSGTRAHTLNGITLRKAA